MSEDDRVRWDARYAAGSYAEKDHPCPLLAQWGEQLAVEHGQARALDLACGRGRNALFLAELGFDVEGLDISTVAIQHARRAAAARQCKVEWRITDLDEVALPRERYALVVVSRYRYRDLPALADTLLPGGTLLYEQHAALPTPPTVPIGGPKSNRFRLAPNQLVHELVPPLWLRHYEEGTFTDPDGATMALSRMVANRPS